MSVGASWFASRCFVVRTTRYSFLARGTGRSQRQKASAPVRPTTSSRSPTRISARNPLPGGGRGCKGVPDERKGMVGYGSLADVFATLEGALSERDYILGDRFSAADVYLGSHLGWGMQFGSVEKRPAFERYWERLKDRPAAKKANKIDDAIMAERGMTPPG